MNRREFNSIAGVAAGSLLLGRLEAFAADPKTSRRHNEEKKTDDDRMTVVQCWDDGVTTDIRLAALLRKHHAKATFNLNAGLHEAKRKSTGYVHNGTEVVRLSLGEMKEVYDGFTIANHSLTHPALAKLPIDEARSEIVKGRKRLQQIFGQPVLGFAYPYGSTSEEVMKAVREAGHVYARTTHNVERPFPPANAMAFHPCCHFLATDLWSRYEKARAGGVFYFWGHSYEISTESMWSDFEKVIERISADSKARWADVADLFDGASKAESMKHQALEKKTT
jgi:peptidoglycan/xylan/chitin deacetylase (PgdA/CDA1 family)